MTNVVCQAVLTASVMELSWPFVKQSSGMDVETLGAARGEQSKLMMERTD